MSEQTTETANPESKIYELGYPLDGSSYACRENLQDILRREMMGPSNGENEILEVSPKSKYILGRIAPTKIMDADEIAHHGMRENTDADPNEEPDEDLDDDAESFDDELHDAPQRRGLLIPSSMGMRFQIPDDLESFTVHCSWGRYSPVGTGKQDKRGNEVRAYQRTPVAHSVKVRLSDLVNDRTTIRVEDTVELCVDRYDDPALHRCFIEVALCNDTESEKPIPVSKWLFQTQLDVDADGKAVFLPVHDWNEDPSFEKEQDFEQKKLRLQYRNRLEFAVGRTCSVDWTVSPENSRRAVSVRTTWLPTADIPQTIAQNVEGAELDMTALAVMGPEELRKALTPISDGYRSWLDEQEASIAALPEHLRKTARGTVQLARIVSKQLADGIDFLCSDEEALRCFHFMNTVMAEQRVHTQVNALRGTNGDLSLKETEKRVLSGSYPHHWRVFQLAFILMQIHALTDPAVEVRSDESTKAKTQLLFFPTGGGKTEAYLGLAAYTFAIRRRQGIVKSPDGNLNGNEGVAVLMRYTLRLLTSQQFQRASTLICAAELERRKNPELWGDEPFRIGLWVGTNVTPKKVSEAAREIEQTRLRASNRNPDVLQIVSCPWCGKPLGSGDLDVDKVRGRVFVHCPDMRGECPFAKGGEVTEGIPVLTTDEEIYRLVPSFVIATVDKFARLAREGAASALFGYVGRKCDRHGYVPNLDIEENSDYDDCSIKDDSAHPEKRNCPAAHIHPAMRLRPPDLIIQDELHLISGALGTTVGLFESAIDVMCTWKDQNGRDIRPMIVASSATMRNAADQIRKLYGRGVTVFPPQVLDVSDTFFSKEQQCDEDTPGRRYIGISTTGVRLSNAEIQTAETLLKGAQRLMNDPKGGNAADPYMTLVGYFSTIRELAGMARFMQDDISTHVRRGRLGSHLPRRYGAQFGDLNVGELTSRISSTDIVTTLDHMNNTFDEDHDSQQAWHRNAELRKQGKATNNRDSADIPFDAVLATSMLQVGVDVSRLGLMMIVGQPKNTAEYIQASSRVGRDAKRPGLVVTIGNWARPRDLAHFEQFKAYHDSFYARVEPLSVTPFSVTALEHGVEGLLVSAVRVMQANQKTGLNPERNAGLAAQEHGVLDTIVTRLIERIHIAGGDDAAKEADSRLRNRMDTWENLARSASGNGRTLVYERAPKDDSDYQRLIHSAEELGNREALTSRCFVIANSMREVQPEINILVSPNPEKLGFTEPDGAPTWQSQQATNTAKQETEHE